MQISKLKILNVVIACPLMIISCGKKEHKTTNVGGRIKKTPDELSGAWLSPCVTAGMEGLPSVQREYIFNMIGDFDKIERYYTDSNCKELGATYKSIGTIEAEGPMPNDSALRSINLTMNDAKVTVHTDLIATHFNTLKLCADRTWVANKEESVIDVSCLGTKAKAGDVIFDVYQKKGDVIFFGATPLFLVRSKGEVRPTKVDIETPYEKH